MTPLDDLIATYLVQQTQPKLADLQTISKIPNRDQLGATLARNVFHFDESPETSPEQFVYYLLLYVLFIVCHDGRSVDAFIECRKDSSGQPQFRLKIGLFELFFTPGLFLRTLLERYLDKFYSPDELTRLFRWFKK